MLPKLLPIQQPVALDLHSPLNTPPDPPPHAYPVSKPHAPNLPITNTVNPSTPPTHFNQQQIPTDSNSKSRICVDSPIRGLGIQHKKKCKQSISPSRVLKFDAETQNLMLKQSTDRKKDYHNAIEKKRRDNINAYIDDIHMILLKEHAVSPNCDKLSTLGAAVDYLKSIKTSIKDTTDTPNEAKTLVCPTIRSEFSSLISNVNSFLLTFKCSDFKIQFVSEGVLALIGLHPSQMIGHEITDFIDPSEVDTFKENHRNNLDRFQNAFTSNVLPPGTTFSCSTCLHTMRGYYINEYHQNTESFYSVLFTGGLQVMAIPEDEDLAGGVLCFSGTLKILLGPSK